MPSVCPSVWFYPNLSNLLSVPYSLLSSLSDYSQPLSNRSVSDRSTFTFSIFWISDFLANPNFPPAHKFFSILFTFYNFLFWSFDLDRLFWSLTDYLLYIYDLDRSHIYFKNKFIQISPHSSICISSAYPLNAPSCSLSPLTPLMIHWNLISIHRRVEDTSALSASPSLPLIYDSPNYCRPHA